MGIYELFKPEYYERVIGSSAEEDPKENDDSDSIQNRGQRSIPSLVNLTKGAKLR